MLEDNLYKATAMYFQLLPDINFRVRWGFGTDYGLLMFLHRACIFGLFQRFLKTDFFFRMTEDGCSASFETSRSNKILADKSLYEAENYDGIYSLEIKLAKLL